MRSDLPLVLRRAKDFLTIVNNIHSYFSFPIEKLNICRSKTCMCENIIKEPDLISKIF